MCPCGTTITGTQGACSGRFRTLYPSATIQVERKHSEIAYHISKRGSTGHQHVVYVDSVSVPLWLDDAATYLTPQAYTDGGSAQDVRGTSRCTGMSTACTGPLGVDETVLNGCRPFVTGNHDIR